MGREMRPVFDIPAHVPEDLVRDFDFVADLHDGDLYMNAYKLHEGPDIFYTPRQGGHWVVTRYADIDRILKNDQDFTNDSMSIPRVDNPYRLLPTESNEPLHSDYRRIVLPYFTPKKIGDLGRKARELTLELMDNFAARGECEFVSEFAMQMPIGIFMSLMDLPPEDRHQLVPVVNEYVGGETLEAKFAAFAALEAYMRQKIEERRRNPGEDMLSAVLKGTAEGGRPLTEKEILGFAVLLLIGGLETVAGALGMVVAFLADYPDLRQTLIANPDKINNAIEEMLRRRAPVMFARTVARDITYEGISMAADDLVLILVASANLDDRRYDDPLKVDFDRPDKRNFAFGTGIHTCIGSFLARTELRVFVTEWLKQIPEYRIRPGTRPILAKGFSHSTEKLYLEWDVA